MEEFEPLVDDPGDLGEPSDWQAVILKHIMVINRELGEVVTNIRWQGIILKGVAIVLVLLVLAHGPEMVALLSRALDLLV